MKKAIIFVLGLILLSVITNAQKVYDQDSRLLNVGVGIVGDYYHFTKGAGYVYRSSPAFSISYEQAYKQKLGPGYLGIGGIFTYQATSLKSTENFYGNERYYYKHAYRNYVLASRATWHWDGFNFSKGELYGGAVIGARVETYSFSTDYPGEGSLHEADIDGGVYFVGCAIGGARWYFTPKVSVFGEVSLGYGLPYLTGGLTFKI